MIPTSFDESGEVLDKPEGWSYDDCEALSILRTVTADGFPVVISCWKPDKKELEEINKTGRVWLVVFGESMPPVMLCGIKPIEIKPIDPEDLDPLRN